MASFVCGRTTSSPQYPNRESLLVARQAPARQCCQGNACMQGSCRDGGYDGGWGFEQLAGGGGAMQVQGRSFHNTPELEMTSETQELEQSVRERTAADPRQQPHRRDPAARPAGQAPTLHIERGFLCGKTRTETAFVSGKPAPSVPSSSFRKVLRESLGVNLAAEMGVRRDVGAVAPTASDSHCYVLTVLSPADEVPLTYFVAAHRQRQEECLQLCAVFRLLCVERRGMEKREQASDSSQGNGSMFRAVFS
ncbi:hypothetical protein FQA47_015732 [Oryzias melastigma]|uniref:Uncharacterized protein n=1 Tax=Oryzias melastigma TaxID=30732 RepID=A0A834CC37_ORYME|nr:hypothetical protein FQA47_015732 [Oryzias melastigma]